MLTRMWFYLTQGTVAQHSLRGPYALGFLAFTIGSAYAKAPFLHERQATSMKHVSKEQVADSNEPESTSSSNVHGMEATTMSNWATLIDGAPILLVRILSARDCRRCPSLPRSCEKAGLSSERPGKKEEHLVKSCCSKAVACCKVGQWASKRAWIVSMMRWRCLHCNSRKGFCTGGMAWDQGQSGRVSLRHPYAHAYAVLTRIFASSPKIWDFLVGSLLSTCFTLSGLCHFPTTCHNMTCAGPTPGTSR